MNMRETIVRDLQAAMKKGETIRLATLRTVKAALMEKEIERRGAGVPMTEEDELAVLMSAAKRRKESIDLFLAGGRKEMADQEQQELAIIQEYLPRQMSAGDVEEVVRRVIQETGAAGARDFGKAMPAAMKELMGKADGKLVQETVKRLLGA